MTKLQILQYAYQTLDKAEGWTSEMLEIFKNIINLDMMEEIEANYTASQDYLLGQQAKIKADGYMTEKDIENMLNDHMADDCNREEI